MGYESMRDEGLRIANELTEWCRANSPQEFIVDLRYENFVQPLGENNGGIEPPFSLEYINKK